jgi:hypothetical protein
MMSQPLVVAQSGAMPVAPKDAFDAVFWMDVPTVFRRWYGPFPPIKAVTGDWGSVGQARTLKLVGGASMREELVHADAPNSFGYALTEIKGPLATLVKRVEGEWAFAPSGNGTTATWQWTLHPRSAFTAPMLPVFARLWRGYARQSLDELSKQPAH